MAPSRARPKRLGSETPRIFTPPLRELTPATSHGFAVIEFSILLGIVLLPWQKWLLIHMLELLEDGSFRFRTVVVLVARQNGKSTVMKVLALWLMYIYGTRLILGTAQDLGVAEDLWEETLAMAEEDEDLAEEIKKVSTRNGNRAFILESGATYKVKAANRKGGRGKTAEVVVLDELREHQNFDAWAAITKTTLSLVDALIIALSNAGDPKSVVLRHLRRMAHIALGDPDKIWTGTDDVAEEAADELEEYDGDDVEPDTLGIFEWSVAPGTNPGDRDGWAQANPSMNYTLPEKNLAAAFKVDPPDVWMIECLCQWPDFSSDGPFPAGQWQAGIDVESRIATDAPRTFGVDVAWDRSASSIAVAGRREDDLVHTEVVANRAGTDWVIPWFSDEDRIARLGGRITVVVQAKGAPASSLIDGLKALPWVDLIEWGGTELGAACGQYYDLVHISGLTEVDGAPPVRTGLVHLPQPILDTAANNAAVKPLGDSWVWNRKASASDISPLLASTGAVWHVLQHEPPPPRSAYEDEGLMVL